jgi:hypothetical protein
LETASVLASTLVLTGRFFDFCSDSHLEISTPSDSSTFFIIAEINGKATTIAAATNSKGGIESPDDDNETAVSCICVIVEVEISGSTGIFSSTGEIGTSIAKMYYKW